MRYENVDREMVRRLGKIVRRRLSKMNTDEITDLFMTNLSEDDRLDLLTDLIVCDIFKKDDASLIEIAQRANQWFPGITDGGFKGFKKN